MLAALHQNINKTRTGKRVLLAPLDWGLGHATRCIPVIHELQRQHFDVWIAAEGKQAALLLGEFPGITILPLKGYRISYAKRKAFFFLRMLAQAPKILRCIREERKWLEAVVEKNRIDIVISDNRFGFVSEKAYSVFITHQLFIKTGNSFTEKIAQKINYRFIRHFNECWVPDASGNINLGGALSHPEKMPGIPVKYIGPLTRFLFTEKEKDTDLLFLLSGPEPQRTYLEKIVTAQAPNLKGKKIVLLRGLPGNAETLSVKNIISHNHFASTELNDLILRSKLVLARSGYSTVMDLAATHAKAIFIPTPGQAEQEYLADYLSGNNYCLSFQQNEFDLLKAVELAAAASCGRVPSCISSLEEAIRGLL